MAFRFRASAVMSLLSAVAASAQTTVFDSGGFEAPFVAGNINNQQGFTYFGGLSGGRVQTAVAFAGAQAVQIRGAGLMNTVPLGYGGGNFYYRPYTFAAGYNPTASGTPFVQVDYRGYTSGNTVLATDQPFAGVYLEAWTPGGTQQGLTPVVVNSLGGVTINTNEATGGPNLAVSTPDGLLTREQWGRIRVELNFATQSLRLYLGESTVPVAFTKDGDNIDLAVPIYDVPFRNTFGTSERLAEIGTIGFYAADTQGNPVQPGNNFYIDDYKVTATATTQFSPVPEPGLLLAVAGAGLLRLRRKK